jgi:hypothetical protein
VNGTNAGKRDDDELRRLEDIRPEEVSTVDLAANRRKFLVVKRDGDSGDGALQSDGNGGFVTATGDQVHIDKQEKLTIPGPVKTQVASAITEALERLASVVNRVKEADETDEKLDQPLPAALVREISAVQAIVDGITRRYPSPSRETAKDEGGEGEGDTAKQKLTIPGPVKKAILQRLTEVMERLMSAAKRVKDAEETDEKVDRPLPVELGRDLTTIASMLGAVTQKYPSPTRRAAGDEDEEQEEEDGKKPGSEMKGAGDPQPQSKAQDSVEVLKLLALVKALLSKLDIPAPDAGAAPASTPATKRAEPPTPTPAVPDRRIEDLLTRVAKSVGSLEDLTKVVKVQGERLSRIAKARGVGNGIPVEKNDKATPEPKNEWPRDLNDAPQEKTA